jgi:hypothetical protein
MKTKTVTYYPHPDLEVIPRAFRKKWAQALKTSKQERGELIDNELKKMCCLGVACDIQGVERVQMLDRGMPTSLDETVPIGKLKGKQVTLQQIQNVPAAFGPDFEMNEIKTYEFFQLNDDIMTHKQIAQILLGNPVKIEE